MRRALPALFVVLTLWFTGCGGAFVEGQHPDAFTADGTFVTASELTATFSADQGFDVHAFSYFGTAPAINQRTVTEKAAIVRYLNTTAP